MAPETQPAEKPAIPKTYRELLARAGITRSEITALSELRPWRAGLDYGITVLLVLAVPLLYWLVPHPAVLLLCVILNIHVFNRLAQIIHASDHGGLFTTPAANSWLGNIAASFLGYMRTGHQLSHQQHHLHLNTERDSDRIWGRPEETTREMKRQWLKDLFMVTAAQRLMQYSQSDKASYDASPWRKLSPAFFLGAFRVLWPVAIAQIGILMYYGLLIGPGYYFVLYALPIVTIYPAQIRIRAAVEHSFDADYVPANSDAVWVARSVNANPFERFVIAPLNIPYHFEHHLLPGVPYYNLPRLRQLLEEKGFPVPTAPGYFGFLRARVEGERASRALSI